VEGVQSFHVQDSSLYDQIGAVYRRKEEMPNGSWFLIGADREPCGLREWAPFVFANAK
jgi:hypothetical protein